MATYNPIRVFAAMTAHPVNQQSSSRATATPELDQATAAAMCHGMPDIVFKACLLKWAGDKTHYIRLRNQIILELCDIANAEKWKLPKGKEYLRKMAEIALGESVEPKTWNKGTCKALYLGMAPETFYRVWKRRYEQAFRIFDSWTQEGYRYVQYRNTDE